MFISYKVYDTYQSDLFLLVFTAPFETPKHRSDINRGHVTTSGMFVAFSIWCLLMIYTI